jgi:hypothetical protein
VVASTCPLCDEHKQNKYGILLSLQGGYNDETIMHLKGGEFPNPVKMVRKTTCGLSFQLTKGGINDGIEDGCPTEIFDKPYAIWA